MHTADQNFLGLEPRFSDYKTAKTVILPAPFEASTSYQEGTKLGPKAILEASQQVELYDIELARDCHTQGIHTLETFDFSKTDAPTACKMLYEKTKKVLEDGKFPIMLGGEHTISYGMFEALFEKYPNLSIFHIDAHTDMREAYEGNPYSHASVLYLMRKSCKKTVSIGIRSMCEEERLYVNENKVPVYYDFQTQKTGFNPKDLLKHLTQDVYVTIDVDGLSPTLVPSTGTPEPGGLGYYETLDILREIFKNKNVVGCDFVELMPIPGLVHGDFAVAKLIYKCIGYKYYL
ncbi:MAG: agmatinase [Deltaproteobacteria bacterium RIFCSPHIGHO2_02_FULL_40_11]|nr:MAG: agmatinase [Deltaproteobacteria bacterium RIFCSPHIGHO2_02_FULL_40_11]